MAVCNKVEERAEIDNGLDMMWNSQELIVDIVFSFREFRDLCIHSQLFSSDVILQIDQCAIDFRQLSSITVTVAKRVSNVWLDTAILFFEHIDSFDKPSEMLILLGDQAQEFAICFKIIAAWARHLAAKFHETQDETIQEVEEFRVKFESAVVVATESKEQRQKEYKLATEHRIKAEEIEYSHKKRESEGGLLSFFTSTIRAMFSERRTGELLIKERMVNNKLAEAVKKLQEVKSRNEKAKIIAEKAKLLIDVLKNMEKTCETIATFWRLQAENYASQGIKMGTSHVRFLEQKVEDPVVKDNLKVWEKARDHLKTFADTMIETTSSFNFVTSAKPSATQKHSLPTLKLNISVPPSALEAIET